MKDYREIINSAPVVLVEFYADWCPHCRRMMPVVAEVKEKLEGQAVVFQIEIDSNQAAASEAGVESIPTFLIYKEGEEVWRNSGEMSAEDLVEQVKAFC